MPETLEQRCLLAASTLTPSEQFMLELVNRARSNPSAEAARLGINLNQGLAAGTISTAAKQPLAPNNLVNTAADGHTADMLARGFFEHNSPAPNNTTPGQRVTAAGYTWTNVGENIAIVTYNTLDETVLVQRLHDNLFRSSGHRTNMMNNDFFEVGIGVGIGRYTDNNNDLGGGSGVVYDAALATEKFATRVEKPFITGVVYTDASNGSATDNSFYNIGEQAGNGATVTATNTSSGATFTETIGASGGYSLQVPAGTYNVMLTGGGLGSAFEYTNITVGTQNTKVDFETTTAPKVTVQLTAPSITTQNNLKTPDQQFTLNWSAVTGANRYEVSYRRVATNTTNYVNEMVTANSFRPSAALPIGLYTIQVRVNHTDGTTSPWSTPVSVTVDTPVTLNAMNSYPSSQRPAVSWAAMQGATRYEVWGTNATTGQGRVFHNTGVTATSFTPTANLAMGRYRVWVRAIDGSGLAAKWSDVGTFNITSQPTAPIAPIAAARSGHTAVYVESDRRCQHVPAACPTRKYDCH